MGRPPGRNWRPVMLSLTPDRLAVAEAMGTHADRGHAAQGIYALLDFARQNPAIVAKVNAARTAAANGKSDA